MKKTYVEPMIEVIHYNTQDVILTSSHHHCGTGHLTGHIYEDTTGDTYCDTDDNYHCGEAGSGDYICDSWTESEDTAASGDGT